MLQIAPREIGACSGYMSRKLKTLYFAILPKIKYLQFRDERLTATQRCEAITSDDQKHHSKSLLVAQEDQMRSVRFALLIGRIVIASKSASC